VVRRIRAINADVEIIEATNSVVDPRRLVWIEGFDINRVLTSEPDFLDTSAEHKHDTTVSSVSCVLEHELNVNKLEALIGRLMRTMGNDLFRYKGILAVRGMNKQFVFQGVHMLFSGGFGERSWKAGEKRTCRFVFIGRNLDKQMLRDSFAACKAEETLRFKVGEQVFANVGKWERGTVTKQWEKGNPYTIKIHSTGDNVFGPEDDDDYVRDKPPGPMTRQRAY
jgi:hypothetical protein